MSSTAMLAEMEVEAREGRGEWKQSPWLGKRQSHLNLQNQLSQWEQEPATEGGARGKSAVWGVREKVPA